MRIPACGGCGVLRSGAPRHWNRSAASAAIGIARIKGTTVGRFAPESVSKGRAEVRVRYLFLGLAILLAMAWVFAFLFFHVVGFFIHILLILAVILFIVHLVRPARTA
jgi:hypothetical protein